MPSRMITTTARYLAQMGRLRQQAIAQAEAVARGPLTIQVRQPFAGFVPDIDPNLLDGTAFVDLVNVLARPRTSGSGETLGLPDGYRQEVSAFLPLGDDDGDVPATTAADARPITRIDEMQRYRPLTISDGGEFDGEFIITPMVTTAGDGSTGQSGSMYRRNASDEWEYVPPSAACTAGAALSADRDGRASSKSMPDSCVAPFGATARGGNSGAYAPGPADDLQSGSISEPCWILCNDVNEVMVFPAASFLTAAGTHDYETLIDHLADSTLDSGGDPPDPDNGFKAKSCETWEGRVYFLNTSEAGVRYPRRLRRTAKFQATPQTGAGFEGAGFQDINRLDGEGLRVETLGDVLAVYFSKGVAFARPTGTPTSVEDVQVISRTRGLLGTHAVTAIERNTHFGVFTDGWWLLDQSGRWREVGLQDVGGRAEPKWRQTFFDRLDMTNRHRLYVYYDQPYNLVYIAVPTKENPDPQEVWIWDPVNDRVFFENYPVTCFGAITSLAQAGTIINALVGTIDELEGTIDSYGPIPGFPTARAHGDLNGYVYSHTRDATGYHNAASPPAVQEVAWSARTARRSFGQSMRDVSCVDRVSIEYVDRGNQSNVQVQVFGTASQAGQGFPVVLHEFQLDGERHTVDAWFRYSARTLGVALSGAGSFEIQAIEMDVFVSPTEQRSGGTNIPL